jgi:cytochrome c-type biogenesis protein CcmH/NrfF
MLACAWVAIALAPAHAAEPKASLPDIEDEIMCPICGTLLELSDSPQAERERALIRRLIAEGRSKEQIEDALVAEYGPDVLATPSGHGFDLTAWLVPGIAILLAGLALPIVLRRRKRAPRGEGKIAGRTPPSAEELERLNHDLSSYDL